MWMWLVCVVHVMHVMHEVTLHLFGGDAGHMKQKLAPRRENHPVLPAPHRDLNHLPRSERGGDCTKPATRLPLLANTPQSDSASIHSSTPQCWFDVHLQIF